MDLTVYADGWLKADEKVYRAIYGHNGIGKKSAEGDGVSPEGTWPLREVFYRPDRLQPPVTGLPVRVLTPNDGWCDVAGDPAYNQFVTLPYPVADEKLWRDDHRYDLIVVIGYNDHPVVDGMGSAIFLHVAPEAYTPSTGCAAVSLPDLLDILPNLKPGSALTYTSRTLRDEPVKWPYRPPR